MDFIRHAGWVGIIIYSLACGGAGALLAEPVFFPVGGDGGRASSAKSILAPPVSATMPAKKMNG